jgi:hypothetical protein
VCVFVCVCVCVCVSCVCLCVVFVCLCVCVCVYALNLMILHNQAHLEGARKVCVREREGDNGCVWLSMCVCGCTLAQLRTP